MESTGSNRTVIDIGASVEKNKKVLPDLPGSHALTGCDTVAQCFGIGKAAALRSLHCGNKLQLLGKIDANIGDVVKEATYFMSVCYGSRKRENMSDVRVNVWMAKMSRRKARQPLI